LGQVYVLGFIAQRLDAGVGSKSRIQLLSTKGRNQMSIAMIVIVTIAIILAITGSLVQSLNFLIWVGLVLLALAVISLLLRAISGRK
jgi:Zn-dependent membrane protease YugP